jgi:primary-amine oxidase
LIDPVLSRSYEAVVNLPSNIPNQPEVEANVSSWKGIDGLLQPSLQPEELLWAEEVCKKDPKVKAACDAVGIAQDSIAVDGKFSSLHLSRSQMELTH